MDGRLVGFDGVGDADVLIVLVESVVDTVVLEEETGGTVVEEETGGSVVEEEGGGIVVEDVGGVTLVVELEGVAVGAAPSRNITKLTGRNWAVSTTWQKLC